jgi:Condensin complex subunit 2
VQKSNFTKKRRMILGESGARNKVNFQKASCTLDASIKIYSYRVDETAASTYRVLGNLNRTGEGGEHNGHNGSDNSDNDDDDNADGHAPGDDVAGGKGKKGKRGKKASARLCISDTLEKNPAILDMTDLDREFDVDPLFRKLSKTFDEAGSKGMLLNNLAVSDGCRVMFDSGGDIGAAEAAEEATAVASAAATATAAAATAAVVSDDEQEPAAAVPAAAAAATTAWVDISGLAAKLLELCSGQSLAAVPLCPQFAGLREELLQLGEPAAEAQAQGAEARRERAAAAAASDASCRSSVGSATTTGTAATSAGAGAAADYEFGGDGYDAGADSGDDDNGDAPDYGADYTADDSNDNDTDAAAALALAAAGAVGAHNFEASEPPQPVHTGTAFDADAEVVWGELAAGPGYGGSSGATTSAGAGGRNSVMRLSVCSRVSTTSCAGAAPLLLDRLCGDLKVR